MSGRPVLTSRTSQRGHVAELQGRWTSSTLGETCDVTSPAHEAAATCTPGKEETFIVLAGILTMKFGESRRQVVLFGGDRGPEGALGDTWVYDGHQWREMAITGPSPRSIHAMVYDSRRRKVVLFGGVGDGHTLGDTWEWDGTAWARMAGSGPPPRALHGLAYDAVRGRSVLFGGQTVLAPNEPSLADTWEWDGDDVDSR